MSIVGFGLVILSVLILPAAYSFLHWLVYTIGRLINRMFQDMDTFEKTVSILYMGFITILLVVFYTQTSVFLELLLRKS